MDYREINDRKINDRKINDREIIGEVSRYKKR
jgi:hypothetical protein